jgi:hypothetical protein
MRELSKNIKIPQWLSVGVLIILTMILWLYFLGGPESQIYGMKDAMSGYYVENPHGKNCK